MRSSRPLLAEKSGTLSDSVGSWLGEPFSPAESESNNSFHTRVHVVYLKEENQEWFGFLGGLRPRS